MAQLSFLESMPDQAPAALWKVYIDGAARKNPGPAGAGVYITKNGRCIQEAGFYLGKKTNNQAEYGALLIGIFLVKPLLKEHDMLALISDSQLLVRQLTGHYKVKHTELIPLHQLAKKMLTGMSYTITHVLRENNVHADRMANEGIDKKQVLPPDFIKMLHQHDITW